MPADDEFESICSGLAGTSGASDFATLGSEAVLRDVDLLTPARDDAARFVLRAAGAAFLVVLRGAAALPREAVFLRAAGFTAVFLRVAAARFAVFLVVFFAEPFFADFDFRAVAITSSWLR
jgi:hypothetical protein